MAYTIQHLLEDAAKHCEGAGIPDWRECQFIKVGTAHKGTLSYHLHHPGYGGYIGSIDSIEEGMEYELLDVLTDAGLLTYDEGADAYVSPEEMEERNKEREAEAHHIHQESRSDIFI